MSSTGSRIVKIILPILVIGISIAAGKILFATAPEAERKSPKPSIPMVEVSTIKYIDYPLTLQSRGNITPQTQGELVAEVNGRILKTSPNFKPGGTFDHDEVLIELDPVDYRHAITIAEAELAQANLALEKTRAEAKQAEENWKKLALSQPPTALTLHRPQLQQAEANHAAAQAKLEQSRRDLQRTTIRAPYAGRILEKRVEVGQYITRGAALATLYATDVAEVRLPITDRQSRFLPMPESGVHAEVSLSSPTGASGDRWQGQLVRSEAAIDSRTQQLYVVAQIKNPYHTQADGTAALRIGQFVRARIEGTTLRNVAQVPRVAVHKGNEVLVVDENNKIRRHTLQVVWQQADQLIVSGGLQPGDRIITTALPYAPEGMQVKIAE